MPKKTVTIRINAKAHAIFSVIAEIKGTTIIGLIDDIAEEWGLNFFQEKIQQGELSETLKESVNELLVNNEARISFLLQRDPEKLLEILGKEE